MDCPVCTKQLTMDEVENASFVAQGQVVCSYLCYEIANYAHLPQPEQLTLEFLDAD